MAMMMVVVVMGEKRERFEAGRRDYKWFKAAGLRCVAEE